jgi:hypothetical protein
MGVKHVYTMYLHIFGNLRNYIYVTFQISVRITLRILF